MSSFSKNEKEGLYQIGYNFRHQDEKFVGRVEEGRLFRFVSQDYAFDGDETLWMVVDLVSQGEDDDDDLDARSLFEMKFSTEDLPDYSDYLKRVAAMIDAKLERNRKIRVENE